MTCGNNRHHALSRPVTLESIDWLHSRTMANSYLRMDRSLSHLPSLEDDNGAASETFESRSSSKDPIQSLYQSSAFPCLAIKGISEMILAIPWHIHRLYDLTGHDHALHSISLRLFSQVFAPWVSNFSLCLLGAVIRMPISVLQRTPAFLGTNFAKR